MGKRCVLSAQARLFDQVECFYRGVKIFIFNPGARQVIQIMKPSVLNRLLLMHGSACAAILPAGSNESPQFFYEAYEHDGWIP